MKITLSISSASNVAVSKADDGATVPLCKTVPVVAPVTWLLLILALGSVIGGVETEGVELIGTLLVLELLLPTILETHSHQSNFLEIVHQPFALQTGQAEVCFAYTAVLLLFFQYLTFLSIASSPLQCTYLCVTCAVRLFSVDCLIGVSVLLPNPKKLDIQTLGLHDSLNQSSLIFLVSATDLGGGGGGPPTTMFGGCGCCCCCCLLLAMSSIFRLRLRSVGVRVMVLAFSGVSCSLSLCDEPYSPVEGVVGAFGQPAEPSAAESRPTSIKMHKTEIQN
ncbi:hypothetical protein AGLY_005143 [Aphis glycines]|uniref:Uncharacterized protein n=1 Tax=Aphis glycines TaxID=307491 RepID=A0A6G0TW18_APHGL|nr:hypothetical protein AGLY_005143 [Aphis glycines]